MILDPDRWPMFPLLPMKRYENRKLTSFGWIVAGSPTKIHLRSLDTLRADLKDSEVIEYGSVDDLLAAGWIVD
jgi:hypothetical protein